MTESIISFKSGAKGRRPSVHLTNGPSFNPLPKPSINSFTPSQDITDLLNLVFTLRDQFEVNDPQRPADTTFIHCVEVISKLTRNIRLPELDVDVEGYFELEWYNKDKQFSLYITDSRKAAYAYYFNKNDHGSGYVNIDDLFDQFSLTGISRVFAEGSVEWLHKQAS